jgi:hypothetical protein
VTRRYVPIQHDGTIYHIRHETVERLGVRRMQSVDGALWPEIKADHSRLERDYPAPTSDRKL